MYKSFCRTKCRACLTWHLSAEDRAAGVCVTARLSAAVSWLQALNKEFTVNVINECAGFYQALKSGKTENKGLELA